MGHLWEVCRQSLHETSFSSPARNSVFLCGTNSREQFWGLVLCIGRACHPGPTKKPSAGRDLARHVGVEVLNVGGWLTHGDSAVETDCDFLVISDTRLIPARSKNEAAKLRRKNVASICSLACQATSHVGAAGVGMGSLKGAPVSMPSIATANLDDNGRWPEPYTGSCLQVLAELHISFGFMVFKELTRTRRNLHHKSDGTAMPSHCLEHMGIPS